MHEDWKDPAAPPHPQQRQSTADQRANDQEAGQGNAIEGLRAHGLLRFEPAATHTHHTKPTLTHARKKPTSMVYGLCAIGP